MLHLCGLLFNGKKCHHLRYDLFYDTTASYISYAFFIIYDSMIMLKQTEIKLHELIFFRKVIVNFSMKIKEKCEIFYQFYTFFQKAAFDY